MLPRNDVQEKIEAKELGEKLLSTHSQQVAGEWKRDVVTAPNDDVIAKDVSLLSGECKAIKASDDSVQVSGDENQQRCQQNHVLMSTSKTIALVGLLYLFVCSLDFLGSAFRLLGGRAAGATFSDSHLLQNPIAGLMIGVLATVLVQSSSTSSSIVVTMVASGILDVQPAIPIVMGANIGTSLTNTIVSLAQCNDRNEFRRAFAGATVHDMFNWLTVIVLLPLEMASGYLYHLTGAVVSCFNTNNTLALYGNGILQTVTKPFTDMIIQLDKNVIEGIAVGDPQYADRSLLKSKCSPLDPRIALMEWCKCKVNVTVVEEPLNISSPVNLTVEQYVYINRSHLIGVERCNFVFNLIEGLRQKDAVVGGILLVFSLLVLCGSLVLMVKILNSALRGSVLSAVTKTVNYELPGCASYFTGYIAMLIGAVLTILVQSSSVFTSVLTPLVGVGVVELERMYPLTLGSNIGTTTTGILAALAASPDRLRSSLQISFCHMFFNVSGILLFYPIPQLRIPIRLAKIMGNTTAKYRWFAILYVVVMFFLVPLTVFGLSMAGTVVLTTVATICLAFFAVIIVINALQNRPKFARYLPRKLKDWSFLPLCLHSLKPADDVIMSVVERMCSVCVCCSRYRSKNLKEGKSVSSEESLSTQRCDLSPKKSHYFDSGHGILTVIDMGPTDGVEQTDSTSLAELRETLFKSVDSAYSSLAPSRQPSSVNLQQISGDSVAAAATIALSKITPAPSRRPSNIRLPIVAEFTTSEEEAGFS